ncbi:MAG TPA: DUF2059 domain-containing protein [Chthoniobacteraceae bacterium]|nr:DUF2059 domain-containing protein [Chthoniobacteraceae bacterium]
MKTLAVPLFLIALICLALPLRAQDAAKDADAVDPKRAAAAEALLKAMHVDALMERQKQSLKDMFAAQLPKNLPPEEFQRVKAAQDAGLEICFEELSWETLKPDFIRIYSEVYTEQELRDLASFYNSPTGQKFLEHMPELQAKTGEILNKRMIALMPAIRAAAAKAAGQVRGSGTPASGSESPQATPEKIPLPPEHPQF